jgi:hypothetical protein
MTLALLILAAVSAFGQAPANWFNVTNGDTNCHARLLTTGSTSIFFSCSNPRGSLSGTYVPAAAMTATDVITVGLSAGLGNTGNNICMIAINVTANPVTIGSFGSIPAQSVGFQCAGSAGETGTVSIAPLTPSARKKGNK